MVTDCEGRKHEDSMENTCFIKTLTLKEEQTKNDLTYKVQLFGTLLLKKIAKLINTQDNSCTKNNNNYMYCRCQNLFQ